MAAHVFLAVASALYVFSRIFSVAGCEDRCSYPTVEFASRGFWIMDTAVLLLTLVAYFVLRSRLHRAWIVPSVGIAVTSVASIYTIIALNGALVMG